MEQQSSYKKWGVVLGLFLLSAVGIASLMRKSEPAKSREPQSEVTVEATTTQPKAIEVSAPAAAEPGPTAKVEVLAQKPAAKTEPIATKVTVISSSQSAPAPVVTKPAPAPVVVAPPAPAPAPVVPQALSPIAPAKEKAGLQLFAALGVNYVQYNEDLDDVSTNYHDLHAPSYNVGAEAKVTDRSAVEFAYKTTPMKFDNSGAGLSSLEGTWQTATLQWNRDSDFLGKNADGSARWAWLIGLQTHDLPLVMFKTADHSPVFRNLLFTNLSLGARWTEMLNPRTRAVILGRWQYPISASPTSAGANFDYSPVFLFDGSVGVDKNITDTLWIGLHWYGQYHQVNFHYQDSEVNSAGSHSVLFSNAEVRFTFDF